MDLPERLTHNQQRIRLQRALDLIWMEGVDDGMGGVGEQPRPLDLEHSIVLHGNGGELDRLESQLRKSLSSWALPPAETPRTKRPRFELSPFKYKGRNTNF